MLSCKFYFLKNLTDFSHIILQPAGKFNPKFFQERSFANKEFLLFKHLFIT